MTEYRIEPVHKFSLGSHELWQYRELFFFFTWRDIKVRYKQATLGILWAILQPLSMMVLFTFIFSRGLGLTFDGLPYPLFAFSGLMIWHFFSNSLQNAASSMVANAHIIRKIYFPRLIIPLSAILTALFDVFFAFLVWVFLIFYYQYPVALGKLFLLPLSILLAGTTAFGIGTFLAALNIKYRDFRYVLPFLIQFLMFINPVVYSTKAFVNYPVLEKILELNPIAGAINMVRSLFSNTPVDGLLVLYQFGIAFLFLLVGLYFFRKVEAYFADLV
ncbi:MAG: ABC transporter permease [Saprospiraceae bacterium]|nr:ABC transporter permease [Saprospiraceae bacterium]